MLSRMITSRLISASIIEEKNRELYEYSISSLLGNICNIISCILIGAIIGEILRAIVFLLIMIPFRSSIGGCHLKSPILCYVASCGIALICISFPEYILFNKYMKIYLILTISFLITIAIIAPVDCIEKPMSEEEKKLFHIRVIWMTSVLGVSYILLFYMRLYTFCVEVFLIACYALSTLLIEKFRKYIQKR